MKIRDAREMLEAYASDVLTGRKVYYNGNQWETLADRLLRRLTAVEAHLRNLEDRYAEMENRLNDHAQGTKHRRPAPKLPKPDAE